MSDWSRRQILATAGAALGAAVLPSAGQGAVVASRSGLPWASGATSADPDAFAAMRGRPLDILTTFGVRQTWAQIHNRANDLASLLDPAKGNRPETVVVTYPLFPDELSPKTGGIAVWQQAATGAFDAHHIAAAQGLTRFPQRFIFRIGHEWNCCYPWQVKDAAVAPYYKAYFARTVTIFRKYHPTCLIDWCSVKRGELTISIDFFYPDNDYVDIISHDKYDMWTALRNKKEWDADFNKKFNGGPKGIGAWLTYAKSKGKPLGVAEWGVINGPSYPAGGGDNAYFVSQMLAFFRTNAPYIAYESYYNRNNTNLGWNCLLTPPYNPKARAAYQAGLAAGA